MPEIDQAAAALRGAFDAAFAEAPRAGEGAGDGLLALRVSGEPYAVRLAEVAALHRDRKVVALASHRAELLGLAAFRGALVPVYDLGALLGLGAARAPRWLMLARATSSSARHGEASVALAFDALDAHLRVAEVPSEPRAARAVRHVAGAVRAGDAVRPLLDLGAIVETIETFAQRLKES
jgi:purine-binding chemotaxis protein CheW